jgi:hypothetical protein
MKLIARTFILGLVAAGATAIAVPMHATKAMSPTSQFMSASAPMPACAPGGCKKTTGN